MQFARSMSGRQDKVGETLDTACQAEAETLDGAILHVLKLRVWIVDQSF